MADTPLQRRHRLANRILDVVREAGFQTGHHLREQALGDLLKVSRTPVRAALQLLAERGILEARRNQGFFLRVRPEELGRQGMEIPASVGEDLYARIVRDRLAGRLDASFIQSDLARRYEVDRPTLQRALTRLVDDGLLLRRAGRGWTFPPTLDTALGLRASYGFRRVVEPAALLAEGFRAEPAALERSRLRHLFLEAHPDIESVDRRLLFDTDAEFHEMLAAFSGNPFFLQAVQGQNRMRRLLEFGGYVNRRRVRDWCREHLAILDAVAEDDRTRAAGLMEEHLARALAIAPSLRGAGTGPARRDEGTEVAADTA